ncbi:MULTISPECIES: PIG-L deacetylase family protein [unclassified Pseudoclavibacter]|uniref:PIG-L deacetylase family protein n=1 Tax=unclassified Pseudoclavibacter TaxID=2615177 RepID=UPI000CE7A7CF|nr:MULTISPECIES: PIG-L deacetylase family protein [unclassified Pseudoclavibacter]MBS3177506.1 PIG-L family deacetylase [Pseudoclavibacter sp. Marseille-Q4354]NYF13241.1 LmbE family N-acetylglucosaminyl deacetylase [Pseudoclavibacter sp. JAI123]PPG29766.1 PIG-L family deacetylase [Pseudoclavibacter sp. RFBB5]
MIVAVLGASACLGLILYVAVRMDRALVSAEVGPPVRWMLLLFASLLGFAYFFLIFHAQGDDHAPTQLEVLGTVALCLLAGLLVVFIEAVHARRPSVVQPKRVLVVGAHPDDLELACGGTVASYVDGGHQVKVLVMSRGQRGGDPSARILEAHAGAAMLGVDDVTVHDFPDTQLADANGSMIRAIESAIASFAPTVILTHSEHDHHQDHQAVHRAVVRAGRQASSILCFESPSVTRQFNPSMFVDIDAFIDVKVKAVQTHRDQAGKPYMTSNRVRGIAAFRGAQAKCDHAEGFELVRYLQNTGGRFS